MIEPMTTAARETTSRTRWALPFLAALVAVLATVFGAASVSAATGAGAETRVRASQSVAQDIARPPEAIRAGQRLGNEPAGVVTAVATGVAANAGDDVTRLYRAVDLDELKDIVGTGVYRSAPGGTEGKYFFPTKAQAENFSNLMGKTGTGPYCITSGCIPRSTLNGIETISPAGEGTAYFIPQNLLPQFRDIIIHGPQ